MHINILLTSVKLDSAGGHCCFHTFRILFYFVQYLCIIYSTNKGFVYVYVEVS